MFIYTLARREEDRLIWRTFQHHSRTFSFAARLLPGAVQMPIATLYLFCRTVDDIADERPREAGTQQALDEVYLLRERLDATLAGRPPDALLWRRLCEVHAAYGLYTKPLYELIDGALWDLRGRTIESRAHLVAYAELVGGSIGAMMLPFLVADRKDMPVLEAPARALGIAMQITNIARDVGEDLRHLGRLYLPHAWMGAFGITRKDLARPQPPDAYPLLMELLMETAEAYYDEGLPGVEALPFQVRTGIRAAARIYREIMNGVRARGYDNLHHRAYVPLRRKLQLVLQDDYEREKARLLSLRKEPARQLEV